MIGGLGSLVVMEISDMGYAVLIGCRDDGREDAETR
jgi:hypothetical protein